MSAPADYTIVPALPTDRSRIETFMRANFYRYEPLNASLGTPTGHHCTDSILPLETLHQGTSLLAVGPDEAIVGICLNGDDDADETFDFEFTVECGKLRKFIGCVMRVHAEADVLALRGVTRALDVYVLAVDPAWARRGIGRALVGHAVERIARPNGYPLVSVMCTSRYTARIAESLGFECVYTLRYDQHLDGDGAPVFAPPEPHDAVRVFVLSV